MQIELITWIWSTSAQKSLKLIRLCVDKNRTLECVNLNDLDISTLLGSLFAWKHFYWLLLQMDESLAIDYYSKFIFLFNRKQKRVYTIQIHFKTPL